MNINIHPCLFKRLNELISDMVTYFDKVILMLLYHDTVKDESAKEY